MHSCLHGYGVAFHIRTWQTSLLDAAPASVHSLSTMHWVQLMQEWPHPTAQHDIADLVHFLRTRLPLHNMLVHWFALVESSEGVQIRDQCTDALLCLELGPAVDLQGLINHWSTQAKCGA